MAGQNAMTRNFQQTKAYPETPRARTKARAAPSNAAKTLDFPTVGIVASPAGLAAFKRFLSSMLADTGLAFVLAPQPDSSHDRLMVEVWAKYAVMPVVQVGQGMLVEVDCMLPLEQIPNPLAQNVGQLDLCHAGESLSQSTVATERVKRVMAVLQVREKCDFRDFRKAILWRRIQKRMRLPKVENVGSYLDLPWGKPEEATALYRYWLSNVTGGFQAPEAYVVVERALFPKLALRHAGEAIVRIWIPSRAMDKVACRGIDPASTASELSPERHRRSLLGIEGWHTGMGREEPSSSLRGSFKVGSELARAKEELQLLDEELSAFKSQPQGKLNEGDESNGGISKLIASTEIAALSPDSELRTYLQRTLPYRAASNRLGDVPIDFLDLLQQKNCEALQRADDAYFHKIFANAIVGIVVRDWQGNLEKCNPAYCALLGYSDEELRRTCVTTLIHRDDLATYMAILDRLRANELQSFVMEIRFLRKDGSVVWGQKYCSVLSDESGKPTHLLALVTNTTERRRTVSALQKSKERLRAVLNTAADAIITVNRANVIESANASTAELFGYAKDELVGQNIGVLVPQLFSQESDGFFEKYLNANATPPSNAGREVTGRRRDGSVFPVEVFVKPVVRHEFYTAVLTDISDRKELQKHTLEFATNEQRRIGQELHDGTQQELTALAMFASTLLEDLGHASYCESPDASYWRMDRELFNRLQRVALQVSQGLTVANRNVHQLSHGIMPLQIGEEGLRSALEELATANDIPGHVRCRFDSSGSISVQNNSTATHMYRIAQEALNNAIRHGPASEVTISCSQEADRVILEIRDNGGGIVLGIAKESQKAGKGMGLRIMEYRANLIDGVLQIERNGVEGTTVRCTVPAKLDTL